jgi:hypothetical protein
MRLYTHRMETLLKAAVPVPTAAFAAAHQEAQTATVTLFRQLLFNQTRLYRPHEPSLNRMISASWKALEDQHASLVVAHIDRTESDAQRAMRAEIRALKLPMQSVLLDVSLREMGARARSSLVTGASMHSDQRAYAIAQDRLTQATSSEAAGTRGINFDLIEKMLERIHTRVLSSYDATMRDRMVHLPLSKADLDAAHISAAAALGAYEVETDRSGTQWLRAENRYAAQHALSEREVGVRLQGWVDANVDAVRRLVRHAG